MIAYKTSGGGAAAPSIITGQYTGNGTSSVIINIGDCDPAYLSVQSEYYNFFNEGQTTTYWNTIIPEDSGIVCRTQDGCVFQITVSNTLKIALTDSPTPFSLSRFNAQGAIYYYIIIPRAKA